MGAPFFRVSICKGCGKGFLRRAVRPFLWHRQPWRRRAWAQQVLEAVRKTDGIFWQCRSVRIPFRIQTRERARAPHFASSSFLCLSCCAASEYSMRTLAALGIEIAAGRRRCVHGNGGRLTLLFGNPFPRVEHTAHLRRPQWAPVSPAMCMGCSARTDKCALVLAAQAMALIRRGKHAIPQHRAAVTSTGCSTLRIATGTRGRSDRR